jgi:hypothetical protein
MIKSPRWHPAQATHELSLVPLRKDPIQIDVCNWTYPYYVRINLRGMGSALQNSSHTLRFLVIPSQPPSIYIRRFQTTKQITTIEIWTFSFTSGNALGGASWGIRALCITYYNLPSINVTPISVNPL